MMVLDKGHGRVCRVGNGGDWFWALLLVVGSCSLPLYASSSKPRPTLCPPVLKFFPSIRADRVTFTPGLRVWV